MTRRVLFLFFVLLALPACGERVLFFEQQGSNYASDGGYSEFAKIMRSEGFDIATLPKGELTKDTLENYDVLVIMDAKRELDTDEISAMIWFVLNQGKGLLINGDGGGKANQLTVPFGVTIDEGELLDPTDPIPGNDRKTFFTLDRFEKTPQIKDLAEGVSKLGFYEGSGITVSGDTMVVLRGDMDTYSDTGSFPAGSAPPVAAASILGQGRVLILSDPDIMSDEYINDYHNRKFAVNVVNWLRSRNSYVYSDAGLQELKVVWGALRIEMARLNLSLGKLETTKGELLKQNDNLKSDIEVNRNEIEEIKSGLIGPFTKNNLAFMFLGVAIFLAALITQSRRGKQERQEEGLTYEMGKSGGEDSLEPVEAGTEKDIVDELDDLDI